MQKLLKLLNISQSHAARLLGVDRTTVNRWCRGKSSAPDHTLFALWAIECATWQDAPTPNEGMQYYWFSAVDHAPVLYYVDTNQGAAFDLLGNMQISGEMVGQWLSMAMVYST